MAHATSAEGKFAPPWLSLRSICCKRAYSSKKHKIGDERQGLDEIRWQLPPLTWRPLPQVVACQGLPGGPAALMKLLQAERALCRSLTCDAPQRLSQLCRL